MPVLHFAGEFVKEDLPRVISTCIIILAQAHGIRYSVFIAIR
jgi:hypothetical protein